MALQFYYILMDAVAGYCKSAFQPEAMPVF